METRTNNEETKGFLNDDPDGEKKKDGPNGETVKEAGTNTSKVAKNVFKFVITCFRWKKGINMVLNWTFDILAAYYYLT